MVTLREERPLESVEVVKVLGPTRVMVAFEMGVPPVMRVMAPETVATERISRM